MKYGKHLLLIFLIVLLLFIGSCGVKGDDETLKPITINLTYIPNIQFAPFYVAIDKGYFVEEGYEVNLVYGNETDLVALVGSGNQNLMIASGEQVLLSRAQGLPVVYVMAWYGDYPVGIVSLAENGILSPADLEGKVIGIPGLFGASYIGAEALLRSAGLSDQDVELNSIGFSQVEAITTRQVDAAVVYVANEPIVLQSLGNQVNLIRVADYIDLVGNGLVTNEVTLRENPALIRAVIKVLKQAINDCQSNPDEAFEISKKYIENLINADQAVQKAVLTESMKLWQSENQGYSQLENWENMQRLLLDMSLLKAPVELERVFNNEYIP